MTVDELLPCPHHKQAIYPGRTAKYHDASEVIGWEAGWWEVIYDCPKCGWSYSDSGDTEAEADEVATQGWNTRYEHTCTIEHSENVTMGIMSIYRWWRLSCGHEMMTGGYTPSYCEECGAKEVDE